MRHFRDFDALVAAVDGGIIPADFDWSAAPVFSARPPDDTQNVWSYTSVRQLCGADAADVTLRPDVVAVLRPKGWHDLPDGYEVRLEAGRVTVTTPEGQRESFAYDARTWRIVYDRRRKDYDRLLRMDVLLATVLQCIEGSDRTAYP